MILNHQIKIKITILIFDFGHLFDTMSDFVILILVTAGPSILILILYRGYELILIFVAFQNQNQTDGDSKEVERNNALHKSGRVTVIETQYRRTCESLHDIIWPRY
jgi:hypothetical protein